MEWQTDSVHFVLFTSAQSSAPDALQPWVRIFGVPPQSYQQNPQGVQAGGMSLGLIGDYQVMLSAAAQRLELALFAKIDEASLAAGQVSPVHIEDFDKSLIILSEYASKIIPSEGVTRVAFVANFSIKVTDAYESAAIFFEKTKITRLEGNTIDLSFGVNVRRKIGVNDYEINRVCRWATAVGQTFSITFTGNLVAPSPSQHHAATLNIDLNTVIVQEGIGQRIISAAESAAILSELVSEAKLIKLHGYDRLASID